MGTTRKRAAFTPARLERALFEATTDLIFVMAPDGRYLLMSQPPLNAFGIRAKDVAGKTPEEIFGPKLGGAFSRNNAQVIESGKPLQLLEWLSLPIGMRCYSTLLTPVKDRKGRVEAVVGIGRDISELRRLSDEQELHGKQMELLFRQRVRSETLVKDIIQRAIAIHDLDAFFEAILPLLGTALDVSRVYYFEYDRVRQKASNTHEWVAPGVEPLKNAMQNVPVSSQPWWMAEMLAGRMIRLDDVSKAEAPEVRELFMGQGVAACLAIPVFAFNYPHGFIGFDESRRVRAWDEMDVELLSGVARIIAQKIERARLEHDVLATERLAAIGRLTASFTHEINNPLQAVLLHLEGLEGHVDAKGEHHLERVVDGFHRIAAIVRGLLNVNRGTKEWMSVDINEVMRKAYALISHQAEMKGINVRWHLEPRPDFLIADEQKLQQVFLNVLLNAVDSMQPHGELTIATSNEAQHVRIDIEDTGCGIEDASLPYVFDPFFTTKEQAGTGLGLYVSHAIVKEHQGTIDVQSRRGMGTTVSIRLPVTFAPEPRRAPRGSG